MSRQSLQDGVVGWTSANRFRLPFQLHVSWIVSWPTFGHVSISCPGSSGHLDLEYHQLCMHLGRFKFPKADWVATVRRRRWGYEQGQCWILNSIVYLEVIYFSLKSYKRQHYHSFVINKHKLSHTVRKWGSRILARSVSKPAHS